MVLAGVPSDGTEIRRVVIMEYVQCRLTRKVSQGIEVRVSWIPSEYAVEGSTIRLRDAAGSWSDGWRVGNTLGPRMTRDQIDSIRRTELPSIVQRGR